MHGATPSPPHERLSSLLADNRQEILSAYRRVLQAPERPLLRDPSAVGQAVQHAAAILDDVVASLQCGEARIAEGYKPTAWRIGEARAVRGVHPADSFNAAAAFFDITMTHIVEHALTGEQPGALVTLAARALNQSIMMRISAAATTYTSYLLNKIHQAHVDERQRIARELHDRVGSGLSVAHRQLELVNLYSDKEPLRAKVKADVAYEAVVETMEQLRAVTDDLRVDETPQSLEKTLLHYLNTLQAEDVEIRLQVNGDERWAGPDAREEAVLILREAVRNAVTHAAPSAVYVRLDFAPHELRAWVEDDGCGFAPDQDAAGLGLVSMRERAALAGGTLRVSSQPGRGTQVELVVPRPGASHA